MWRLIWTATRRIKADGAFFRLLIRRKSGITFDECAAMVELVDTQA